MECRAIHSNHSCRLCSPGASAVPSHCSVWNVGSFTRITLAGYAVLAPLKSLLVAVHTMQVTPLESPLLVMQSWHLCSMFSLQCMQCRSRHSNHSRWSMHCWHLCSPFSLQCMQCRSRHSNHSCWSMHSWHLCSPFSLQCMHRSAQNSSVKLFLCTDFLLPWHMAHGTNL